MRKFRTPDQEYSTDVVIFDAGNRKLSVKLNSRGVLIRGARQSGFRFLGWGAIYDRATGLVADFDAGPAKTKTIVRGAKS